MNFYIPNDFVLLCAGLTAVFLVVHHYNKREDERMRQEEAIRLGAMSAEERETERTTKKNNDDFMRGVGKYPSLQRYYMYKKIEEKFERWMKDPIIYWIALMSGIIEEILKRRRRTTLATGAIISLLAYLLKQF